MIFDYPSKPAHRRHGPSGYSAYQSYRPWLRDEFRFRCIYCLKRETWGQITGEFDLDHFRPQVLSPELAVDYLNLVYACGRCNLVKLSQEIDDPIRLLSAERVSVSADGYLQSTFADAVRLIRILDLNGPSMVRWRIMWMRIVELAEKHDARLCDQILGYPSDLPDLSSLRPPRNTRPEGIAESFFAMKIRGSLPNRY